MTDREKLDDLFADGKCPAWFIDNKQRLDTVDYLIANGVTVGDANNATTTWISVEDRLPEPMEWMLCFCSTNVVHILRLDDYGHYWTTQSLCNHYKKEYVTHWMPLPQPPKEVE